jgi:hypothetical protein
MKYTIEFSGVGVYSEGLVERSISGSTYVGGNRETSGLLHVEIESGSPHEALSTLGRRLSDVLAPPIDAPKDFDPGQSVWDRLKNPNHEEALRLAQQWFLANGLKEDALRGVRLQSLTGLIEGILDRH